jgi:beta-galactosidase
MEDVPSQWGWPDELPSWTWRGLEGKTLSVRVFSRAPRVRLELNGRSLGERSIEPDKGIAAVFEVPYSAGELKATALSAEGAAIGSRTLVTSDAATKLVALPELDRVRAAREQLIYVPVEVRDRADRLVDDAEISLAASVAGEAEILGFGSANPASLDAVNTPAAHTFRGRALLILRSTGKPGSVHVALKSPGLPEGSTTFSLQ